MVSVDPILTTGASGLSVTWPQKVAGALYGLDDAWLVLLAMELVLQLYYREPMDYPCKPQLDNVKLPLTCLCLAVRLKTCASRPPKSQRSPPASACACAQNGRLSASEKPPQSCFRCRAATC